MPLISNQNAEIPQTDTSGQVQDIPPVERVDPMQSEQFSDLLDEDNRQTAQQQVASEEQITPEELQRQIQENLFKNGFNRTMDKAREIAKELREG